VIVQADNERVISLEPEFIVPQDVHEKWVGIRFSGSMVTLNDSQPVKRLSRQSPNER